MAARCPGPSWRIVPSPWRLGAARGGSPNDRPLRVQDLPVAEFCISKRSGAMIRQGLFVIGLAVGMLAARLAPAQETQVPATQLSAAAREAAKTFHSIGAQDVARQRAELAKAMSNLDAFLRTGAAYKSIGWKRYLQW